jgi:hypothetical protein
MAIAAAATQHGVASVLGLLIPSTLVEACFTMFNASLLNLDNFDNTDPHILTVLLIGTEDNIRTYIHQQHRLGVTEAGAWSRLLPMSNCPGKLMSILNKAMP